MASCSFLTLETRSLPSCSSRSILCLSSSAALDGDGVGSPFVSDGSDAEGSIELVRVFLVDGSTADFLGVLEISTAAAWDRCDLRYCWEGSGDATASDYDKRETG